MNMFDKKLGKQLWERIKVFHGSSYISEESLTKGDGDVMQEIQEELADAREYVTVLEHFLKTYQIAMPLRTRADEPLDLKNIKAWADVARNPMPNDSINWRLCYAEDVPRLLTLLRDFNEARKSRVKSRLLNGTGTGRKRARH